MRPDTSSHTFREDGEPAVSSYRAMLILFKTGGLRVRDRLRMHQVASLALGTFLLFASILHFAVPSRVEALVPDWWPLPRLTVYASGLAELALGVAICLPQSRAPGAALAAVMMLAYALVHVDDLRRAGAAESWFRARSGVIIRTLANLLYAAWALFVALVS